MVELLKLALTPHPSPLTPHSSPLTSHLSPLTSHQFNTYLLTFSTNGYKN